MHSMELDSTVGWTPQSLAPRCSWHQGVFSYLLHLSIMFHWKTPTVNKIPSTICDLWYYFHINIFRLHWEITIVKQPLRYDAHRGVWLGGGMHTAEFFETFCSWLWGVNHSAEFLYIFFSWLCGVNHTAESDSAVECTQGSFFFKSWWNQERICQGAQMGFNHEKKLR